MIIRGMKLPAFALARLLAGGRPVYRGQERNKSCFRKC